MKLKKPVPMACKNDPDVEAKENLEQLWAVLAKLIEQGGDLPAQTKKLLRGQIQSLLVAHHIKSLEDYDGLSALQTRLDVHSRLPEPAGYPSREVFEHNLARTYAETRAPLPRLPSQVFASEVATYGQSDWSKLTSRGLASGVDYLYDLGKILASEFAYTVAFNEIDAIEVGSNWKIENGRHRALALRSLGSKYVSAKGMNQWVEVRKEK